MQEQEVVQEQEQGQEQGQEQEQEHMGVQEQGQVL
jgi:hypothetical protein